MTCFHSFRNFFVLSMCALATALPAKADLLELTNGDHYRGTILSMTASNIEFQSEVQGRITLPREKVGTLTLHPIIPKTATALNPASNMVPSGAFVASGSSTNAIRKTVPVAAPANSQANAVIQQMRQQGVEPKLIEQVQEQIFGKSSPEAAQKFNEMMGGLMTGQLSIADIRSQAQNSIKQIEAAKKELGGDAGDMLDSYMGILEKFLQETTSESAPQSKPATPVK